MSGKRPPKQAISVSITGASEMLEVSRSTLRKWVNRGLIPTFTYPGGSLPRIRVETLHDFLEQLEKKAEEEREEVRRSMRMVRRRG